MTAELIAARCNLTRKIGPISLGINQVLGNFQMAFVRKFFRLPRNLLNLKPELFKQKKKSSGQRFGTFFEGWSEGEKI